MLQSVFKRQLLRLNQVGSKSTSLTKKLYEKGEGRSSRYLTYVYNTDGSISDTSKYPKRRRKKVDKVTPSDLDDVKIRFAGLEPNTRWGQSPNDIYIGDLPHPLCAGIVEKSIAKVVEQQEQVAKFMNSIYETKYFNSRLMFDYIEFRTFEIPEMGIKHIASIFEEFGYKQNGKRQCIPGRVMEFEWLSPKPDLLLPRIVISSIKLEEMTERNQQIIIKCLDDWLVLSKKYLPATFGMAIPPWKAPTVAEYESVYNESDYAAWVLVNGYRVSCVGLSVHGMINPVYRFGKIPESITLENIVEATEGGPFFWNPTGEKIIKEFDHGNIRVCAPVAELGPFAFGDGKQVDIPRSYIACIERKLIPKFESLKDDEEFTGFKEEHFYDGIPPDMIANLHASTETAMPIALETMKLNEDIRERAKRDGKVLNMETANDDDWQLYEKYFREVMDEKMNQLEKSEKPRGYNEDVSKPLEDFDGTDIDIPGVVTLEDIPTYTK